MTREAADPGVRDGRGSRTRSAILAAAQRQFTEHGFQRTTIRSVAAEAGIDASMVMRYYGSKDGLFAAATRVDVRLADVAGIAHDQLGRTAARHFVALWDDPTTGAALRALLTSAISGTDAARQTLLTIFTDQIQPMVEAAGPDRSAADVERRAALIGSQMIGFAISRYVLKLGSVATMSADEVVDALGPVIQLRLDS